MDKGWTTNTISAGLVALSYGVDESLAGPLRNAGLFALSGALTNQLAIHMLFEKVPYLYGSGIILDRFETIRDSIKAMIMEQFFTPEKIESFFQSQEQKLDLAPIIEETDFTPAYTALVKSVMESPLGSMLGMFGGEAIIAKLKEPFLEKIKSSTIEIAKSESFLYALNHQLQKSNPDMQNSIEMMVENRLNELTPEMVKELIHKMIREHLGWLVVWGGVFGGIIGVISSFLL